MPRRYNQVFCSLLVISCLYLTGCYRMAGKYLEIGSLEHKVTVEKNVMVEMRDGLKLATDIYRPKGVEGPLPVVLTRLPYNKNNIAPVGRLFAQRGYIYIVQDCRACFHSEGEVFVPMIVDREDGIDTAKWISEQPFFNGNLGMWGASYLGVTQWAIAADIPELKAMYPQLTTARLDKTLFVGGAFTYRLAKGWSGGVGHQNEGSSPVPIDTNTDWMSEGIFNKPLKPEVGLEWTELSGLSTEDLIAKLGVEFGGNEGELSAQFMENMIGLMSYPAFAQNVDAFHFQDRYKDVAAPSYMVAGWYDIFIDAQLEDYMAIQKLAPESNKAYTKLVIGPWGHASGFHPDAGKDAKMGRLVKELMNFDWYDHWLKGEENGVEDLPPLHIYVMGENIWRDEYEWPLARTAYTNFYLRGEGNANGKTGDGVLSKIRPLRDGPPDKYIYDPNDPVLTVGGHNLLEDVGAKDQKTVETRDDVLVYTSAPMTKDLEVTGPITAVIYAASSAVDTDFTVKLCDVYPNGLSYNLTEGIIRARYRDSVTGPSLIEPGKIYKYEIKLWPTSNSFQKGHRIRIQVASSSFPRFDRNSNAGGEGGPDNTVIANQTIYHDDEHPSHIILPVIP